ncbi:hypothetical protein LTR78_006167 [Recurvomyces mirabilis]|uniref:WW domain-containing protein n=1 Tax=Recurvomyces mirabilis TaxID=574656 RepID=A0AAE0WLL8_9PEZI|nr:hypothetical protein LTR78_006167 [Recurvomyces mirabilis]KAK5152009.1 hypothetical protein LTS14_008783 [Recurvomyces mirabilis]
MESPAKRLRPSPAGGDDFVSFAEEDGAGVERYGYGNENEQQLGAPTPDHEHHRHNGLHRDARFDRRNAEDRPKSKHALPGYEPWILVKTKLGRRFVHNQKTKESFWYVPKDVWPAVKEFDAWEKQQKEKAENARWAEEELKKMRESSKVEEINAKANAEEGTSRRRRSESLQREDEEAMMAELAAEAERAEEQDVKEVVEVVEHEVGDVGYDSDGSYEYVEVTDDEGAVNEIDGDDAEGQGEVVPHDEPEEEAPVEFGEDDIAWQLAAMGKEYGLDPEEYGDADLEDGMEDYETDDQGLAISDEDAANLFRDLLDDYHISPFTPWDKLISDESEASILNDDRYTVLPNMRARKEVWDVWTRDKAAQIKEERAKMEKLDPRIPYLAFLAEKANPKLYWPEFKRKFKREPELNDRKLSDKDREKLYRDHINRLKLQESTRKADLLTLLKTVPLRELNSFSTLDTLPQPLLSHLHFISLLAPTRDQIVRSHIRSLPAAPAPDDLTDDAKAEAERNLAEKQRREAALAQRQRVVEEDRRRTEKEERYARGQLRDGERELERVTLGSRRG